METVYKGIIYDVFNERMKTDIVTEHWYLLLPQFNSFASSGQEGRELGRKHEYLRP